MHSFFDRLLKHFQRLLRTLRVVGSRLGIRYLLSEAELELCGFQALLLRESRLGAKFAFDEAVERFSVLPNDRILGFQAWFLSHVGQLIRVIT